MIKGKVVQATDKYKLKKGETELTEDEYKAHLYMLHGPQKGGKSVAPVVMETELAKGKGRNKPAVEAELLYRGMSVNNISNLRNKKPAIFTVQNPDGEATPEEHIVDDDQDSPYLSFEAGGLEVSAGKYAPKPVDKDNRPLGVSVLEGGFLKQEKSYVRDNAQAEKAAKQIGFVGGIRRSKNDLDYSTQGKASVLGNTKARDLAIADKEVLVRPGPKGIALRDVPFMARVQRVDKAYYLRNINNQTLKKALGVFDTDNFYKIQIIDQLERMSDFSFNIPPELLRKEDSSDDEMSDIEELDPEGEAEDVRKVKGASYESNDGSGESSTGSVSGASSAGSAGTTTTTTTTSSASSAPKPAAAKPKVIDVLVNRLRELIATARNVEAGRAGDASAEDIRAMFNERYAKEQSDKGFKGKEEHKKKEKDPKEKELPIEKEEGAPAFDASLWNIVDYGAGGDCLFLSLNANEDKALAQNLRTRIVRYQHANNLVLSGTVDLEIASMLRESQHPAINALEESTRGKEGMPPAVYYNLMSFQGTWGGRAEISAFTLMPGAITVYVMESTGLITSYIAGVGTNIPVLPPDAFAGTNIVLFKTANHWQRISGPKG